MARYLAGPPRPDSEQGQKRAAQNSAWTIGPRPRAHSWLEAVSPVSLMIFTVSFLGTWLELGWVGSWEKGQRTEEEEALWAHAHTQRALA